MSELFDRKVFFDSVRGSLFDGALSQQQVDGQNAILADWEGTYASQYQDLRWLSYPLATTKHETANTMWPIEEYNKGAGMEYGKKDPKTGKVYFGRGDVQLTWAENYQKATARLGLSGDDDLYWHPERALDPFLAGHIMFRGMIEGWFRSDSGGKQTLSRYFNDTTDDAYMAREIINGDRKTIPNWSNGVSIGNLIKGYHEKFLTALEASLIATVPDDLMAPVALALQMAPGTPYSVMINQVVVAEGDAV
jgi:predicted chitinase